MIITHSHVYYLYLYIRRPLNVFHLDDIIITTVQERSTRFSSVVRDDLRAEGGRDTRRGVRFRCVGRKKNFLTLLLLYYIIVILCVRARTVRYACRVPLRLYNIIITAGKPVVSLVLLSLSLLYYIIVRPRH